MLSAHIAHLPLGVLLFASALGASLPGFSADEFMTIPVESLLDGCGIELLDRYNEDSDKIELGIR